MTTKMPLHIQKMLEGQNVADVESMDTGSGGVPRISLKKSKFTAKIGDDEVKLGDEIDVVIVGISPEIGFAKTFYESGYSPSSADAPTCQSDDGTKPNGFVESPVSDSCRTCEKNQWGSAKSMSGGKAKACKDSKRLHIVMADDILKVDPTVYILTVTVLSLKPFGAYGKTLAKEGIPTPAVVITTLSFDDEASVPKLEFVFKRFLDVKQTEPAIAIATDRPWDSWKNITRIDAPKAKPKAALANPDNGPDYVDGDTITGEALDQWDD